MMDAACFGEVGGTGAGQEDVRCCLHHQTRHFNWVVDVLYRGHSTYFQLQSLITVGGVARAMLIIPMDNHSHGFMWKLISTFLTKL